MYIEESGGLWSVLMAPRITSKLEIFKDQKPLQVKLAYM